MFIVLNLHRESLRQMINQGRVNHSIKIEVLRMLRPVVCSGECAHGDIKEILAIFFMKLDSLLNLKYFLKSLTIYWWIIPMQMAKFQTFNV